MRYRHVAQENMGAIAGLFEALGEALPGFDSISLTESGENTRALKVAFRGAADDGRPDRYGFGQLSDGQRALSSSWSSTPMPVPRMPEGRSWRRSANVSRFRRGMTLTRF